MLELNTLLDPLIRLSQWLAEPERDLVILGEGNTSMKVDEREFYVKASGFSLRNIEETGFVRCAFDKILPCFDQPQLSDAQVKQIMFDCRVANEGRLLPSIETFLHAYLLSLPGINFVGHTHATPVNSILCSADWKAMEQVYFPDQIVCCGRVPCFVEYFDPGIPLAIGLKESVEAYAQTQGELPKLILMRNHGMIAIGKSPKEIESITLMAVKTARILLGAQAMGGLHPMDAEQVERIYTRPDEHYRRALIEGMEKKA